MKKNKMLIVAIAIIMILSLAGGVISIQNKSDGEGWQPSEQAQGQDSQGQKGEATVEQTNTEASLPEDQSGQLSEVTEPNVIEVVIPNEDGEDIVVQIGAVSSGVIDIPEDSQHSNEHQDARQDDNSGEMDHNTQQPDSTFEAQVPTQPNGAPGPDLSTTYEEYMAMSAEEQTLFYYSFADADAFHAWYNSALAAYQAGRNDIIVGEGAIDMEEILRDNER